MKRIFFIFFLLYYQVANAETAKLSLAETKKIVFEAFPEINAAKEDINIAKAKEKSNLGNFDLKLKSKSSIVPKGYYQTSQIDTILEKDTGIQGLKVFGGYRYGDDDFAIYDQKLETLNSGEVRAGLILPILRGREIDDNRAKLKISEVETIKTYTKLALKRISILQKASQKYWKWVGAGLKYDVSLNLLNLAKERAKGLEDRVKAGDLAEFELKDNLRTILKRQSILRNSEREFQKASIELSFYTLKDKDFHSKNKIPSFVNSNHKLADESQLIQIAKNNRPELKILKTIKEQALTELEFAKNNISPKLDFILEVSDDIGSGSKTKEPSEIETGIMLEIPLQRRKQDGEREQAEAKLKKIEQEIKLIENLISVEIQDSLSALRNAKEQIQIIEKELETTEQMEIGERERFLAGQSTLFVVNLREQNSADVRAKKIEATIDFKIALANLEAALGQE